MGLDSVPAQSCARRATLIPHSKRSTDSTGFSGARRHPGATVTVAFTLLSAPETLRQNDRFFRLSVLTPPQPGAQPSFAPQQDLLVRVPEPSLQPVRSVQRPCDACRYAAAMAASPSRSTTSCARYRRRRKWELSACGSPSATRASQRVLAAGPPSGSRCPSAPPFRPPPVPLIQLGTAGVLAGVGSGCARAAHPLGWDAAQGGEDEEPARVDGAWRGGRGGLPAARSRRLRDRALWRGGGRSDRRRCKPPVSPRELCAAAYSVRTAVVRTAAARTAGGGKGSKQPARPREVEASLKIRRYGEGDESPSAKRSA